MSDPSSLRAGLAAFEAACLPGLPPPQHAQWQRVAGLLIDNALAQPAAVSAFAEGLRGRGAAADEEQELDRAVRWWQAARREGLALDDDFGEVWRAIEWLGVLFQLQRAGALDPAAAADERAPLLDAVVKVALRYAPLKPLLPLIEPLSGRRAEAGFTF